MPEERSLDIDNDFDFKLGSLIFDNDNWSFVIPFSNGSQEIEIIGTYVIPEFGTIVLLILVIAISSIVVISTKNKQIFYPNT